MFPTGHVTGNGSKRSLPLPIVKFFVQGERPNVQTVTVTTKMCIGHSQQVGYTWPIYDIISGLWRH